MASAGFLYGDATPSPLKSDFIAFLRDAVDYAVVVLGADARMAAGARDVEQLAEQTERENRRRRGGRDRRLPDPRRFLAWRAGVPRRPVCRASPAGGARPRAVRVGRCARLGHSRASPPRAESVQGVRCLHQGVRDSRARTRAAGHTRRHGRHAGRRPAVRGDPRMPDAVRSRMDDGARHPGKPRARARDADRSARRSARGRGAGGGRVDQQGDPQPAAAARSPVPDGPERPSVRDGDPPPVGAGRHGRGVRHPAPERALARPAREDRRRRGSRGAFSQRRRRRRREAAGASRQPRRPGRRARRSQEVPSQGEPGRDAPPEPRVAKGAGRLCPRERRPHGSRDREAIARAGGARDQAPRRGQSPGGGLRLEEGAAREGRGAIPRAAGGLRPARALGRIGHR